MALMAWSTVAFGGNSIFGGAGAAVDAAADVELAASDGSFGVALDSLGVVVVVCDVGADSVVAGGGAGGVSGGGAEVLPPPHAANPNSSGRTSAPTVRGSARLARN
jgi:hypothetical protein